LGGSFNPPHFGHLRLAVEILESLRPERLDFVPCANPPHKSRESLLPFELRCAMLKQALAGHPAFRVNTLEGRRAGPSFTCETLADYRREYAGARLYFILGSEDFSGLDSWKDWHELPSLATLAVAARQGGGFRDFADVVRRFWPGAHPEGDGAFLLPNGGQVCYLSIPRLDINSSLIRSRWLAGRSIAFWAPEAVRLCLEEHGALSRICWSGAAAASVI
jgi:nicotinate-nucleotide adenylyltransferase